MLTPKSRTKELMIEANLSRKQQATVKKQLLFGFVLQSQLNKKKRGMKPTQIGSLRGMIGGDILNKYHLKKFANKEIGLGRNRMNNYRNGKVGRNREVEKHKEKVIEFLERDDNSRANPGKRDKIKDKGVTNQTRTLVDYLKNLHQKFISENPGVKLSLTSFCRIRPAHIRPTAFISRSSCLCTRHQNMALCVRALKKYGMNVPLNPEYFINDEDAKKVLENDIPETVKFGQWKRVAVDEKGKKKMVMKIVEKEMKRDDFLEFMKLQIDDFKAHVSRVKRQYSEIGALKSNLKRGEIIMHMDFAENYACKTVEEVQSAYWTQTGVTLHPIVVYYIDSEDKLSHQSFVVVSDEMGHNSSTVLAFLDMVHPEVRKLMPDLKRVHYWTDSPTSQYRNKTIFSTVARHKDLYNTEATWNYFECGHGKGPCDGLGGITKRMADEAVRSGKVIIQDGQDFFAWTQSNTCTMQRVKFVFVSSDECQKKAEELGKVSVKPIKGTMKIHAVVGTANGSILTADHEM